MHSENRVQHLNRYTKVKPVNEQTTDNIITFSYLGPYLPNNTLSAELPSVCLCCQTHTLSASGTDDWLQGQTDIGSMQQPMLQQHYFYI